jgi:hypothetical protein
MSVELNHTIVWARDKAASAEFLAGVLSVPVGNPDGPFLPVRLANRVTLDFADADNVRSQHLAFLVSESEFDTAIARLRAADIAYWADPVHQQPGQWQQRNGRPTGRTWASARTSNPPGRAASRRRTQFAQWAAALRPVAGQISAMGDFLRAGRRGPQLPVDQRRRAARIPAAVRRDQGAESSSARILISPPVIRWG